MHAAPMAMDLDDGPAGDGGRADNAVLMERLRDGDRDALAALLDRFWERLVVFAVGLVGTTDDAEDVVQDVFVRVWQSRSTWNSTGSASAYLYRITRNLALNALRAGGLESRSRQRAARQLAQAPTTPSDEFAERALRRDVELAITALPDRRREVFVLARFHGLTHREIATVMGISLQTVANQMSAALNDLRASLAHRSD